MDINKILSSGLINRNKLAAKMYPNNSKAGQYLYKKINNKERQSLTQSDTEKIIEIFSDLIS